MLSITAIISTTLPDELWIALMVLTTSRTTLPPRSATCDAWCASSLACAALSAFWRTVLVSCSIDAAVSSIELA